MVRRHERKKQRERNRQSSADPTIDRNTFDDTFLSDTANIMENDLLTSCIQSEGESIKKEKTLIVAPTPHEPEKWKVPWEDPSPFNITATIEDGNGSKMTDGKTEESKTKGVTKEDVSEEGDWLQLANNPATGGGSTKFV